MKNKNQSDVVGSVCAVYGRTSAETDDAFSVSSQIDAGLAYAHQNGFVVPEGYVFREDFTGKALERPEYNRIRELIRARRIAALIIYATDRFARKVGVSDILLDELLQYGVQLHIVAWNSYVRSVPEDRLRFNFEMTFSDFERSKIVERTVRGKIKKLKEGYLLGCTRAPYGYTMIGTRKRSHLAVVDEQAEIVQEIFHRYVVEGAGTFVIARNLTGRAIPSPGDLRAREQSAETNVRMKYEPGWNPSGIYEILKREVYAGRYPTTIRGETIYISVPAIVSEELWEGARTRLREGKSTSRRNTIHDYLMARRLRCANCNRALSVHFGLGELRYYKCGSRATSRRAPHCGLPYLPIEPIDKVAWEFTKELLLTPARLYQAWKDEEDRRQQANAAQYTDLESIQRRIEENKVLLARTLDRLNALSDDERDADEREYYEQKRSTTKQLLVELRDEQHTIQVRLTSAGIPEQVIRNLIEMADEYRALLEQPNLEKSFMRGLVDDLDIRGIAGIEKESERQYIDFIYCGKTKRRYVEFGTEPGGEHNQMTGEGFI